MRPLDLSESLQREIRRWKAAVDPDDVGLFARRLQWGGLDEDDLESLLMPASSRGEASPEWKRELDDLCEACLAAANRSIRTQRQQADHEIAFSFLLRPVVDRTVERLREECPDVFMGIASETVELVAVPLLRRLSEVCGRAFAEDFADTRPVGRTLILRLGTPPPGGHSGTVLYEAWCRRHLETGLRHLLERFPPLGRLMVVVCGQWRENVAHLLRRLKEDRGILEERFGIPRHAPLSGIDWELGDSHRGGQRVALLLFGDASAPVRVVYKPKDMRMEAHFQEVVEEVGRWLGDPSWRGFDVVCRGADYGYAAFVEGRPCADAAERSTFYRNAGRLLALLHFLGATDAHCANLIAAGSLLHLIDAETLFQSRSSPDRESGMAEGPHLLGRMGESVLRCGFLPVWTLVGGDKAAIDISALGVHSPAVPVPVPGWLHVNTDDMVWAEVARRPDPPPSLPVPFGISNPLAGHADAVEAGFEEVYRLAMREPHRERLLAAVGAFDGASRRLVLRATRVYALLQEGALAPEALSDANSRAFVLEKLARRCLLESKKGPLWNVFQAELFDMENLDIPYFEHSLGGDELTASSGPVSGLLPGNGLAEAMERIRQLDEDDLAWQKRLIRASIRARHLEMSRAAPGPATPADTFQSGNLPDFGDMARSLAEELDRAAFDDGGGRRSWLTLSLLPDGTHVQLGPIGNGLYDGLAGLAVMWFLLAETCRIPAFRQTAVQTVTAGLDRLRPSGAHARYRAIRDAGLGWSGYGGLLRLFRIPWVVRGCEGHLDPDREFDRLLAELPVELIQRDGARDFLSGVAGLILPIAQRHREAPGEVSARILRAAADRLMAAQTAGGGWMSPHACQPLAGLAHGASGMGLALIAAGAALSDPALIDAGARAFAYERAVFVPQAGNWPDFRVRPDASGNPPSFMVSWCHGAPGIGLARWSALEWAPGHPDAEVWREDLAAAMRTTAESPPGTTDHLCCGNLGRAAILRIAGQRAAHPEWVEAADFLTRRVVALSRSRGRFQLSNDDPGTTGSCAPGLMNGLAGIAVHLTCMKTDGNLGDFLL